MARKKLTAADFPAEFMDAWKLAVKKQLLVSFDSAGTARNWIQRMYTFRKRLMEEAPALAAEFYLVDLRVHDEAGNVVTGKATAVPGKAQVRVYEPEWKKQIKQASTGGVGEGLQGLIPAREEPVGTQQAGQLPVPVVPTESGANSSDPLSETLVDLGYGIDSK